MRHDVGAAQQLERGQLGRGELEGADVEPLVEGVLAGEAQLPDHLAVQRREEEADPVGLRQQFGHVVDPTAVGGEAQLGPLPLDAPG